MDNSVVCITSFQNYTDRKFCRICYRTNRIFYKPRIASLKEKAFLRLKRVQADEISLENISFIVEDYYEVIKELLIAYLLKYGLKSSNHQCLISYFYKKNPDLEKEAYIIAQMSFFRNRLAYYGEDIPMDFYHKNRHEFEKIISLLLGMVDKEV